MAGYIFGYNLNIKRYMDTEVYTHVICWMNFYYTKKLKRHKLIDVKTGSAYSRMPILHFREGAISVLLVLEYDST